MPATVFVAFTNAPNTEAIARKVSTWSGQSRTGLMSVDVACTQSVEPAVPPTQQRLASCFLQVRETSAQLGGASEQALTAEEAAQGGTLDQLLSRCCSGRPCQP